ncbi:MAG: DNA-3-methyladenine glycosylase I, partial [Actinomycetota bacterium]
MEAPTQIKPKGLADYLGVLTKAVFQSGISWRVVEAKWAGTREAFRGFDPEKVANLTPKEIDELAADTRLI